MTALDFLSRSFRAFLLLAANMCFLFIGLAVGCMTFPGTRNNIRARAYCTMIWADAMCRILGIEASVGGYYRSVQRGFTVCNHVSYVDILVLARIRPSVFIAKQEVAAWPFFGLLARLAGTVFIDRSSKKAARDVSAEIERVLESDVNIVVFPEGTTGDGAELKEFKSALFNVPAGTKVPVIPVSIRYAPSVRGRRGAVEEVRAAWYGDMELLPHLWDLLGLGRIPATLYYSPAIREVITEAGTSHIRKVLTRSAFESVSDGLSRIDLAWARRIGFSDVTFL